MNQETVGATGAAAVSAAGVKAVMKAAMKTAGTVAGARAPDRAGQRRAGAARAPALLLCVLLAGCVGPRPATAPGSGAAGSVPGITPKELTPKDLAGELPAVFSAHPAGVALRGGWMDMLLGPTKRPTVYRLARDPDSGQTVLVARAERSASGVMHPLKMKLLPGHRIGWRWRVPSLIASADNTSRQHEDAPVRVVLAFGGDKDKLGFRDQLFFSQAQLLTGQEAPYATLMYIWENRQPVESVLQNPNTGRVRMIVVESGPRRVGRWLQYSRDIRADFVRAYGEEPGPLLAVGVMTDTDNTGATVEAWYGDIRLDLGKP